MRQRYVDAVCKELIRRYTPIQTDRIETIYIGGGTPSQLTIGQLRQLLENVWHTYTVAGEPEVTVEVNPDDVTAELALGMCSIGVNRISMGAQTFDDRRLRLLNRRHTASQITAAVKTLRGAGFNNVSIDLMYGFPGETMDDWRRDIEAAQRLDVEHISAYCLAVEENTPLHKMLYCKATDDSKHNALCAKLPDEELERGMYYELVDHLTAAGYEHYELSNFAQAGYRSRHNSSYWQDIPYIGVGAAAHSYDGHRRSWNVSDIDTYINEVEEEKWKAEEGHCWLESTEWEELDSSTHYNDRITVALRTCEGLPLSELTDEQRHYLLRSAKRYLDSGLLELQNERIKLTREGLFVSNMVMGDLIYA